MIHVANIAETPPDWRWISGCYPATAPIDWRFVNVTKRGLEARLPGPHLGRIRGTLAIRRLAARGWADQVVSHGPYATLHAAAGLGLQRRAVPHLAMSFNFTDLPEGARFRLMARAFRSVDRFAIFSRMERQLYSGLFGLDPDRFDFVYWGVRPPIAQPLPRAIPGRYFVALGGEARDYATLVEAMRRLPAVRFVLVVRPWSLDGLSVPDNVTVHVNLPWEEAWSHVAHAEAALLPLRSRRTPNGHVTIVGGMHLGKAHIVTRSAGIADYAIEGETALLADEHAPGDFVAAIERMMDEPDLAARLGAAAAAFAQAHCTEAATASWFEDYLRAAHPGRMTG